MAAYLVLMKGGRVLLSMRKNTGYMDGCYSLISGHLEEGETAEQCIARESLEEANIAIKPDELVVKHVLHFHRPEVTYIDVFLTANEWQGEIRNMEEDKCGGIEWFPLDHLPENMAPEVRLAIENIRKGIFYGELGW